ncbi:MAG: type II secretion system ATPase GspE [Myxococcota bacterium]|nr:type II secretion system ATPase GspE [Myxococcota bacterium]
MDGQDVAEVEATAVDAPRFGDRRLGQLLCMQGTLEESALEAALAVQEERGGRLGEILVSQRSITERQLMEVLAQQLELSFVESIDDKNIPDELITSLPINFAKQFKFLPLEQRDDGAVVVASADPLAVGALDDLGALLDAPVELVLSTSDQIITAINQVYDRGTAHAAAAMEDLAEEDLDTFAQDFEEAVDLLDVDDEAPIIRLVNSLISQAIKEHASDIHIEPGERELVVRFRIDGVLYEKIRPPKRLQASIVSRIKIQADLNIAEKRLPQDGRIRIKMAGQDVDIRVATAPTSYGERITMRLLDRSSVLLDLSDLGFPPDTHGTMSSLIKKSHGIILVTGPTGSGKTTTLYACLSAINRPDLNILTIEDPVEYQLNGISQTQVNSKIDLSFASGLRSFLRHDPDVIMVGEIRDLETAEIAIQAALTGHLVLSTIHTNDAPGAVTRLVDMGVEPFLVASSVIGILAQRLIRTLCPDCKQPYEATAEEVLELGLKPELVGEHPQFWRGPGCPACLGTGYQGRLGIYELLTPSDEIRQLILQNVDSNTIKQKAKLQGMRSLREDGAQKVLAGITSSAEVLRVTAEG